MKFNKKDYKLFEELVLMEQNQLLVFMTHLLNKYYGKDKIKTTPSYIIAEGEIPVALCAHMDTVFHTPVRDLYYDREKNVCWSPDGLGADDRAGVFGIIQLLKKGFRPHIILSTDEEKGCLGALELTLDYPKAPFDIKYIIQLDRRGEKDCVFYDCNNKDFVKYIESFGFVEAYGTFTDITEYAPQWGVAAVNLSIGYYNEHNNNETLKVNQMYRTIEAVGKILSQDKHDFYKYIPTAYGMNKYKYKWITPKGGSNNTYSFYPHVKCTYCGASMNMSNAMPVYLKNGNRAYCCYECLDEIEFDWCVNCGNPMAPSTDLYDSWYGYTDSALCPECLSKLSNQCNKGEEKDGLSAR